MPGPAASGATRDVCLVSRPLPTVVLVAPGSSPLLPPPLRTSASPGAAPRWQTDRTGCFPQSDARGDLRFPRAGALRPAAGPPGKSAAGRIAVAASFQVLCLRGKEPADDGRRLFPTLSLGPQLFAPFACQPVVAGPAAVLRCAPRGGDRTLLLQLEENRIQRALVDGEKIA